MAGLGNNVKKRKKKIKRKERRKKGIEKEREGDWEK